MAKEHTNPTKPRLIRDNQGNVIRKLYAHAPYNFVPLPKRYAFFGIPPKQDIYDKDLNSGFIELEITTLSPTYVRGMLDTTHFKLLQRMTDLEKDKPEEKEKQAEFFSTSNRHNQDQLPLPSIPGSSLRGMLRNLVEIISFSPIHSVSGDPIKKSGEKFYPLKMLPKVSTPKGMIDPVEAIFGREIDNDEKKAINDNFAGRVSFTNAEFSGNENTRDIWYESNIRPAEDHKSKQVDNRIVTPKILSSPKPTAHAHYLMQSAVTGHDPDSSKENLANYHTPIEESEIRGHKLYWSKGKSPEFEEEDHSSRYKEKAHTRIIALKEGVKFCSRIYFSNLHDEELGALLWALTLPFNEKGDHCHRIGMGKPYGMGAIKIKPQLFIFDVLLRYKLLFNINETKPKWQNSKKCAEPNKYIDKFDDEMSKTLFSKGGYSLSQLKRIQLLEKMMRWQPIVDRYWREETDYMNLQDFKDEAVLPDPEGVIERIENHRKQGKQSQQKTRGRDTNR